VSEAALQANFTNEYRLRGTVRFLKNVMGLGWCRSAGGPGGGRDRPTAYDELMRLAARRRRSEQFVDPVPRRLHPAAGDAGPPWPTTAVAAGSRVPDGVGDGALCPGEPGLRYRWVLEKLRS